MSNSNVRERMERWARWLQGDRSTGFGGYGRSVMERALDGMPGTSCPKCRGQGRTARHVVCPQCGGAGRVRLEPKPVRAVTMACPVCRDSGRPGEVNGNTCFRCRGSGSVTRTMDKVNPAFIRSTYVSPRNPECERIDALVKELRRREDTIGLWFVIWQEYCDPRGGTQETRAQRLLLTVDCYKKRLQRALEWIEAALADERATNAIPYPYKALDNLCHETVLFSSC